MKAAAKNVSAEKPRKSNVESATTVLEESGVGEVKIHENVISSLARRAALGVEGVSRLAGSLLVDNIAEIVGSRRMQDRSITVTMDESNRVSLEIKLNILLGYRLPKVASEVQQAVISGIESATGMTVTKVNVLIQEVETPQEEEEEEADAANAAVSVVEPPIH